MPQSHEMRLLLADNQTGTSNPISLSVRNCDLLGTQVFGRNPGKRGSRQQFKCGARVLQEVVSGGFDIYPTALQLDWLIERMIGNNISAYPAAAATVLDTLPQIFAFVDKGDEIFRYDNLVMATIAITANEGDYMNVRVDFVGKDETAGVSWPASPPAIDCAEALITPDLALNYDSTAYPFKSLALNIDNAIAANQHENAVKRTIFESGDSNISLSGTLGYRTATKALYRDGIDGAEASVTTSAISDGTDDVSYEFLFGNLKIPGNGPTVPEDGEITFSIEGMAYADPDGSGQLEITRTAT